MNVFRARDCLSFGLVLDMTGCSFPYEGIAFLKATFASLWKHLRLVEHRHFKDRAKCSY